MGMDTFFVFVLLGLIQMVPIVLGCRIFGVDVIVKNEHPTGQTGPQIGAVADKLHSGCTQLNSLNTELYNEVVTKLLIGTDEVTGLPNQAGKLVESFLAKHLVVVNPLNTKDQTIVLQTQMTDLVEKFAADHQHLVQEAMYDQQNHLLENDRIFKQLFEDFKNKSLQAEEKYTEFMRKQAEEQEKLANRFNSDSQIIAQTAADTFNDASKTRNEDRKVLGDEMKTQLDNIGDARKKLRGNLFSLDGPSVRSQLNVRNRNINPAPAEELGLTPNTNESEGNLLYYGVTGTVALLVVLLIIIILERKRRNNNRQLSYFPNHPKENPNCPPPSAPREYEIVPSIPN